MILQKQIARLQHSLRVFQTKPWEERTFGHKAASAVFALGYMTIRELLRDRGAALAASLAFISVLSVVPLLSVTMSLLSAFGILASDSSFVSSLLSQLFPSSASGMVASLRELATNSAQTVGGIGAVSLIVIGVLLFNSIEQALTDIWRGSHNRSMVRKFLTFYAMITLGPVLITLSVLQSASIQLYLHDMGLDVGLLERFLPVMYTLIIFTLMNKLLPNAPVDWSAALVGGTFTAVAFEAAKWGFNLYLNHVMMQTYSSIYGTLTLIPIFLVWVYITWFVILIGAEMAYSYQHLRALIKAEAGDHAAMIKAGKLRIFSPVIGLEVLGPIVQGFKSGRGPVSEAELIQLTQYSRNTVREAVDRLIDAGFVLEGSPLKKGHRQLLPARALDDLPLEKLVDAFWLQSQGQVSDPVKAMTRAYEVVIRQFFVEHSAATLVDPGKVKEPCEAERDSVSVP